jgi:ribosomal protein L21
MYAVIKNGGRQYKVSVGDKLEVNRLAVEDGAELRNCWNAVRRKCRSNSDR